MADTLEIFGVKYTNVTGLVATDDNGNDLVYTRGGGSDTFNVTLTQDSNEKWIPDCTYAEAVAAYNNGKTLTFTAGYPAVYAGFSGHDELGGTIAYYVVENFLIGFNDSGLNEKNYIWHYNDDIDLDLSYVYHSTSNANAQPSDVVQDKVFYNADGYQVGTATGSTPTLQAKTYNVSSAGTATVTADSGYDGLSEVEVSVPSASVGDEDHTSEFYNDGNTRKWRTRYWIDYNDGGFVDGVHYGLYMTRNAVPSNTSVTPTESAQTIGGSNYMMESTVTVNAIPSNYVGSGITQRSSSDLTASGDMVIVPSGYYSTQASKIVASMTLPSETSSTNIGAIQTSIIPSTSPRYINIPTGYNSVAKYYYLSPMELAPLSVSENGTYNALDPYDVHGFSSVTVSVPTGTARTSSDLTVSGATVTVPAGLYSEQITKSVASGSATAPASISGTAASVSTGTNTLTLTKTVSVTPTVSAGYVSAGTAGNASVSLTASVTTKAAATITPTTTNQTIAAGTYLTGAQTIVGDADLVGSNILSTANIFGVQGTVDFIDIYIRSTAPTSSVGNDGDIYIQE